MWFIMAQVQQSYELSERLIRAISNWQDFANVEDDVDELIEAGADVNQVHGTLLPLHCACMVQDTYSVNLLIQKGAQVRKEPPPPPPQGTLLSLHCACMVQDTYCRTRR